MSQILFLVLAYSPYPLILIALQILRLKSINARRMFPLGFLQLTWRAAVGSLIGSLFGISLGFAVMFGPSYMTGDFIGLPWLTMLPGLAAGLSATVYFSNVASRFLVLRVRPRHLYPPVR